MVEHCVGDAGPRQWLTACGRSAPWATWQHHGTRFALVALAWLVQRSGSLSGSFRCPTAGVATHRFRFSECIPRGHHHTLAHAAVTKSRKRIVFAKKCLPPLSVVLPPSSPMTQPHETCCRHTAKLVCSSCGPRPQEAEKVRQREQQLEARAVALHSGLVAHGLGRVWLLGHALVYVHFSAHAVWMLWCLCSCR